MEQFDIIFAGGGAAACVTVGRLAAANPSLKILILEAGEHTKEQEAHVQPARYIDHLAPTSTTVSFNVGTPTDALAGRALVVPSGRCLGGGSSVNFTMYARPSASDYDDWETLYENPGWGARDLLPLMKKLETYEAQPNQPTHGYSGPLKVSWGGVVTNVGKNFVDVASAIDKDRGVAEDMNSFFEVDGYGKWPKWIDAETGRRSDAPHHYIYNQDQNPNLVVRPGQKVIRVLFRGHTAIGVEYVADKVVRPNADQTLQSVHASRLVVVSAGAFGSPTILERSGVGAANLLAKHSIPIKVDLPGVGENYQDHSVCFVPYQASEEAETFDQLHRGDPAEWKKQSNLWKQGTGLLASNGMDGGVKLRPKQGELSILGSEFEERWMSYFANAPDKPVLCLATLSYLIGSDPATAPVAKYYSIAIRNEYQICKGSIHVSSGDNAHAAPEFLPGFLNHPADMATLVWGYKHSREVVRRMEFYRGEYGPGHPKFSPESEAFYQKNAKPVALDAPNIKYTEEDNKAIEEYIRRSVETCWHSMGTCAMKPCKDGGVVDPRLNVYGTENLKVADLSICPANVGANTYNVAVTIGEKAAMLIAEDLGLKFATNDIVKARI